MARRPLRDDSAFDARFWSGGLFRELELPGDVTTVEVADGTALHVRSYGPASAQPIVFIHGLSCRIEYWTPQINALAANFRVIAYDQRGLGHSKIGHRGVRPDVLGDDLAAVLDAVLPAGRPAILVGHSFGGITIMAWAQRHAAQISGSVSAVLLANTVAERFAASTNLVPLAGRFGTIRRPLVTAVATSTIPLPPIQWSRRLIRRSGFVSRHADPAAADFLHGVVAGCRPHMRARWGAGLSGLDVVAGVENLTVPTTVLVGSGDRVTPPAASRRIAEVLRACGSLNRFVELPRVGHCANLEAPHAFNGEIEHLVELVRR